MTVRIDQSNATAGGDIAAGDIYKTTVCHPARRSRLEVIISSLDTGKDGSSDAKAVIDDLQQWMAGKPFTRDLEQKLAGCGKKHLLKSGLQAKEAFSKLLTRTTFHAGLQRAYVHVLDIIITDFPLSILPAIRKDATETKSADLTESAIMKLVDKIDQQLAQAPSELGLNRLEIVGMIYYLTGNCHIDWD